VTGSCTSNELRAVLQRYKATVQASRVTSSVNQQRAGWAGPRVAQQQAAVLTTPGQRPVGADTIAALGQRC
jgi:hypothetical protein